MVKQNLGFTQSVYKSIVAIIFMFSISYANAGIIKSELVSLSGNTYQYNFNIINDDLSAGIEWFSIYFDYTLYENLSWVSSPADWDTIIFQPDPLLPDDGIFDSLALATPIALGDSLSGFSMSFDWLGATAPPASGNPFEIYNSNFDLLGSGFTSTVTVPPNTIPEPNMILLFVLTLAFLKTRKNI